MDDFEYKVDEIRKKLADQTTFIQEYDEKLRYECLLESILLFGQEIHRLNNNLESLIKTQPRT